MLRTSNEPESFCPLSTDLHQRLLTFIRDGSGSFADLALEVFTFQRQHNSAYRAFCDHRPTPVKAWNEIPAVPTSAFKEFPITCFQINEATAEFHTSGTTSAKAGKHYFKSLELYDAASRPNFAAHLQPDAASLPVLALLPSPVAAPHSSLAHMLGVVAGNDCEFFIENETLLLERLTQRLCEMQWASQPVMLLGTAFAIVPLLAHLADTRVE